MKKRLLIISILLMTLILCSCKANNPQTAEISFKSNPTTGYKWNVFQSADLFEITSEYVPDNNDPNLAGGGGREYFVLKPVKAGTCEVSFIYQRPWEPMELGDEYTFQLTVTKNMHMKIDGATAGISGDINTLPEIPEMIIK